LNVNYLLNKTSNEFDDYDDGSDIYDDDTGLRALIKLRFNSPRPVVVICKLM